MAVRSQKSRTAGERVRHVLARAWDRVLHVLLFQDAELSEAIIGFFCLSVGIANAVFGSPWGTEAGDLWGGVALALFGVPQIAAAVHGGIVLRHSSNLLGCFAAIANTLRALDAEIPVAIVFYATVTTLCSFFILRTDVHLGQNKAREARLGR